MFRTSQRLRSTYCSRPPRRTGLAITEILLIVLVPAVGLVTWALLDSEFQRGLLAGPKRDLMSVNPVYDAVNMEGDTVLTVQGQGQLRIWDLKQSVMLAEMQSQLNEVRCTSYSAQARLVAVGSAMGKVEIWDLEQPDSPITTDEVDAQEVSDCLFTADGQVLLTAGEDGQIILWNARTLDRLDTLIAPIPHDVLRHEAIRSLGISKDDKLVIAGTHSGSVQIWDLEQRKLVHTHRVCPQRVRPEAAVESVNFLADSQSFICSTRSDGVSIFNLESGARIQKLAGEVKGLRSGLLSADEKTFVAGNDAGEIVIWELATGKRFTAAKRHATIVRSLATSPDGKVLFGGDWDGRVQFHTAWTPAVANEVTEQLASSASPL